MTHPVSLAADPGAHAAVDAILRLVRERTGLDFTGYRRTTIGRRVANRTIALGVSSLHDYVELLASSASEAGRLAERLTIKVSRFYRDPRAFDLLRDRLLPALAARSPHRPLRLWSAGCSRGEEAYTLAMLLEASGIPGAVLASDVDREALEAASVARYRDDALIDLPPSLRERFLEPVGHGTWEVRAAVRRRVVLEWRDIVRSQPGERRFDLACCRNVLIYLDRKAQGRTLERMEAALVPRGYLLLGEAEWPASLASWTIVSKRLRAFQAPEAMPA